MNTDVSLNSTAETSMLGDSDPTQVTTKLKTTQFRFLNVGSQFSRCDPFSYTTDICVKLQARLTEWNTVYLTGTRKGGFCYTDDETEVVINNATSLLCNHRVAPADEQHIKLPEAYVCESLFAAVCSRYEIAVLRKRSSDWEFVIGQQRAVFGFEFGSKAAWEAASKELINRCSTTVHDNLTISEACYAEFIRADCNTPGNDFSPYAPLWVASLRKFGVENISAWFAAWDAGVTVTMSRYIENAARNPIMVRGVATDAPLCDVIAPHTPPPTEESEQPK